MKRILTLFLLLSLCFSLCSCGKEVPPPPSTEMNPTISENEKAEAEKNAAIALYAEGNYAEALGAFKKLEETDEIKNYIRNCGFQILANYIFKKGTPGNCMGSMGRGNEGYYIEDSGIVLYVEPNATGFDYIEFVRIELSTNAASDRFFFLKLEENKDTFWYEEYIGPPADFWYVADVEIDTYTKETNVSFELGYRTTYAPSIVASEEEQNAEVRDTCNDLLDIIAVVLRRLDCGITLADLGFTSYE